MSFAQVSFFLLLNRQRIVETPCSLSDRNLIVVSYRFMDGLRISGIKRFEKGLVSSKRPHLVASSSKGGDAESKQDDTDFLNENNPNSYLAEKLDEVQLRLLELKQTLEEFARNNTAVEDDDDRSGEVDNNFGNGGIGLPANGRRIVYVPVAEVRERPPVVARTSAC